MDIDIDNLQNVYFRLERQNMWIEEHGFRLKQLAIHPDVLAKLFDKKIGHGFFLPPAENDQGIIGVYSLGIPIKAHDDIKNIKCSFQPD